MGLFRSAAERVYRRLLVLYPGDFRGEYGEEMALVFRDRIREEPLLPLLIEVFVDTMKTAPKEHLAMWTQDVRYAVRTMRRSPGFAIVAAGSLAIGIGANAAIFSLADALLLRPLPVARPAEVVSVRSLAKDAPLGAAYASVSYLDYADLRDRSRSFSGLVAFNLASVALAPRADALPQLTLGMLVSGNFFPVLGVEPAMGRSFRPEEDQVPGRNPVAVLSHATWETTFGSDPDVLGKTVRLNGVPVTIVGVAPAGFTGMDQFVRPAVFVPLMMAPALLGPAGERMLTARDARSLNVKGRLRSGARLAEADAELGTIAKDLERAYPDTNRNQAVGVRTQLQARIETSPSDAALIAMLMVLVLLVLLIACANVASLLVSRSLARSREIAVRLAVGAGRLRLVRQLLTESLLLSLLGGALGLGLALAGVHFFSGIPLPTELPIVLSVRLDTRVLLFSLAVSVLSVMVFGLAPALRATRTDLVSALKGGDSRLAGARRLWGRQALVAGQVALSLVLLAATTSLLRGFHRTLMSEPGFRRDGVLLASFDPTVQRYSPERTRAFYRDLRERARALPGVKSAALSFAVPMSTQQQLVSFIPEGLTLPEGRQSLSCLGNVVDPGYFSTFRVPLVKGRAFAEADGEASPRVAIVNEEVARRYWPGQDPIGKRLRLDTAAGPWVEVVGVARTHTYIWLGEGPMEMIYVPFAQSERQEMTLLLESNGDAAGLAPPLRELVRSLDPGVPIHDVRTMEDLFYLRAVSVSRIIVETVASMGLLGLALALVGLYGLMAYSVSRRSREIGIRMAIGADRGAVIGMVARQGLALALLGIALGLAASAGVSRLLASLVTGVTAADPVTLVALPLALLAVTMVATVVPALRAARIDPVSALRQE